MGSFREEKGMLAIERQEQIVSQIRRNGAVRIHELTKQFGVSVETIRRDLLELERQDCLHRVHGGAVGIAVAKQYHRLEERTEENPQKKEELSGYAAGLIREGDIIEIDIPKYRINVQLSDEELDARRAAWSAPAPKVTSGWLARYAKLVGPSSKGAIMEL